MGVTQSARRDVPGGEPVRGIGEVLALLRPDFPDLTISKLRFLEAEGLVEPLRAASGYRKYTVEHVARLRLVLTIQRDRYLPLKVIREHLAAADRGEVLGPLAAATSSTSPPAGGEPLVAVPAQPGGPDALTSATAVSAGAGLGEGRLTRAELVERSGLGEAGLLELEQYGLLPAPVQGGYQGEALTVARVAARLAQYGLQARHLRWYRATADREVALLAQLVPPSNRRGGQGRQHALEAVHELAALCTQLHGALVLDGLRQVLGR
ncbi:MAG TPA: MerR family transcriptional regulator [Micromonosporaceae bacterium]